MKMKLKEVNERYVALANLGEKVFPSKLSFAVSYNLRKLQKETENIENERRKLCEEYSNKDKDGNPVMLDSIVNGQKTQSYDITGDAKKQMEAEYDELLNEEVDIDIRMVKSEAIEQCENRDRYSIPSVRDIFAMSFMIED